MNGRVYDPFLARFVSADPLVPDATDLQAFNRYSYVFNRPCALSDPSGFCPNGSSATGGVVNAAGNMVDSGLDAAGAVGFLPMARAGVLVATVGVRTGSPAGFGLAAAGMLMTLPSLISAYEAGRNAGQAVMDVTTGRAMPGGTGGITEAASASYSVSSFAKDLFTGKIASESQLIGRALATAYEAGRAAAGECDAYRQPNQPTNPPKDPDDSPRTDLTPPGRGGGGGSPIGVGGGGTNGTSGVWVLFSQSMRVCENDEGECIPKNP